MILHEFQSTDKDVFSGKKDSSFNCPYDAVRGSTLASMIITFLDKLYIIHFKCCDYLR